VAGTNTGKSPQLAAYYAFWERAIFNALNSMVLNAMGSLQVGAPAGDGWFPLLPAAYPACMLL
jgi:hypothetical protein